MTSITVSPSEFVSTDRQSKFAKGLVQIPYMQILGTNKGVVHLRILQYCRRCVTVWCDASVCPSVRLSHQSHVVSYRTRGVVQCILSSLC